MNTSEEQKTKKPRTERFWAFLKNLFLVVIILQIAPLIISNVFTTIKETLKPKAHVGLLKITGIIHDSSFYTKHIEKCEKDPEIKALFIKIESPGGMPGTAQALYNEINAFKKKKPVIVLVENVCASAGYYVASAANTIIASPSSLVGSIGVLMQIPNVKKLLDNWNVSIGYIQSGKYKTAGSPTKEMSKEEEVYLQKLSNSAYLQFVKDIAQSRNLSDKAQEKWANGQIFMGNQALELKLIDQIGSHREAIKAIKKLAKIDEKQDIKFVPAEKASGGLMKLLMGSDEEYSSDGNSFSTKVALFLNDVYKNFIHAQAQEQNNITLA
ncbi:MAG: signal peptide peptidase SppA [bacterium]